MKLSDSGTHSFVFRFWPEPWDEQEPQLLWRGHVTHVPGGERLFVQNLGDALNFMAQFLQGTGVDLERTRFDLSRNTIFSTLSNPNANDNGRTVAQPQWIRQGEHPMNEITWKLDLAIKDGPKITLDDKLSVDAYDRIEIDLGADEVDREVKIQPGDNLYMLRIRRSIPDPKVAEKPDPNKLTYKFEGKGPAIPLENQHLLLGSGAFHMLSSVPKWISFTNHQGKPVGITILVGRTATQPAEAAAKPEVKPNAEPVANPVQAPAAAQ
jgi:hypothetical protein